MSIVFGVSNMSKVGLCDEEKEKEEEFRENNQKMLSLRDLLTDFDLVLIFFSLGFNNFFTVVTELDLNMVAIIQYKWSLTRLAVINGSCIAIYMVVLYFSKGKGKSFRGSYVFAFAAAIFSAVIFILPAILNIKTIALQTLQVCLTLLPSIFSGFVALLASLKLLFEMVPENSSSCCISRVSRSI